MVQGILLVDKPEAWTSFDVVNYIRKLVSQIEGKKPKQVKVGHSGTLDPFATGLLVILIGPYTKRASQFSGLDKTYELAMQLGATSSTGDPEGEIKAVNQKKPRLDEVRHALSVFKGQIQQTPPVFSAIKVDGQRAYKLARLGKGIKLEPRQVTIQQLRLVDYKYPLIKAVTSVSSGTYIRSLVEDIGKELKTGAYTLTLRRVSIGNFQVTEAKQPKAIDTKNLESLLFETE